jgi:hypothetical protein
MALPEPMVVARNKLRRAAHFHGGKVVTFVNEGATTPHSSTLLRTSREFFKVLDFLDSIKVPAFKQLVERDPETHRHSWTNLAKCLNWIRREYGEKDYSIGGFLTNEHWTARLPNVSALLAVEDENPAKRNRFPPRVPGSRPPFLRITSPIQRSEWWTPT